MPALRAWGLLRSERSRRCAAVCDTCLPGPPGHQRPASYPERANLNHGVGPTSLLLRPRHRRQSGLSHSVCSLLQHPAPPRFASNRRRHHWQRKMPCALFLPRLLEMACLHWLRWGGVQMMRSGLACLPSLCCDSVPSAQREDCCRRNARDRPPAAGWMQLASRSGCFRGLETF